MFSVKSLMPRRLPNVKKAETFGGQFWQDKEQTELASPMTVPQACNRAIEVPLARTVTNYLPISDTAKIQPSSAPPLTCGGLPRWGHHLTQFVSPLRTGANWEQDHGSRMEY